MSRSDQHPPVLVINAGSSSLKVTLLPQNLSFSAERIGGGSVLTSSFAAPLKEELTNHQEALGAGLSLLGERVELSEIRLVGHRVVHGGQVYTGATRVTPEVMETVAALSILAPLHNRPNLVGIRAAQALLPGAEHVAVFDTAFHSTLPPQAYLYGLPRRYEEEGVRVYGFHGTSHDYVTRRAAEHLERPRAELRLVSFHLGNGASAAAVCLGRSVDTSMGFTPLEGLLMGTRAGELDPGVVLHLLREGMPVTELDDLLNRRSGLLGLSGVSNDMRDVRRAAEAGSEAAQQALDVFCYRIRKLVGAYAAAMNGLDAIIFTAGIGENDAAIRAQSLANLSFFGVAIDDAKNAENALEISAPTSRVRVLVIPTDENGMIARASLEAVGLAGDAASPSSPTT